MSRRLALLLASAAILVVASAYGCDVGHGFVKDDFVWILTSREWSGLFGAATGFFRPIVSLTFAIDYALFGLAPLGYGLTNLALLFACTVAIADLYRALRLPAGVAAGAALVWALNFQGINMAVLWTSGRTALLLTLFATMAAWAWTRGFRMTAALLATLAMWSKEEAFVLPAVLTAWSLIDRRGDEPGTFDWRRAARDTWMLWAAFALSLALRAQSGAYTPSTAPSSYRYQFDVQTPFANAIAYADRVGTTPVAALLLFWLAAGAPRAGFGPSSTRLALKGAVWLGLAFAPTILLPVRSSLYAVMPGVGATLILAGLAGELVRRAAPAALTRATLVLLLSFGALLPAYRIRNERYVGEARLSSAVLSELSKIADTSAGGLVVIRDVRSGRPTAEQAFGALADRAAALVTGGKIRAWIDPAPAELAGVAAPDLTQAIAILTVERGVVRRVQ
jgi:hypothetical protein